MSIILRTALFLIYFVSFAVSQSTYVFTCPKGMTLRGRKDFTNQQPQVTNFMGFTCCPEKWELLYVNEKYFCCPAGSKGGHCADNKCNCMGEILKGGVLPVIEKK
jgi:hypothetical protein